MSLLIKMDTKNLYTKNKIKIFANIYINSVSAREKLKNRLIISHNLYIL